MGIERHDVFLHYLTGEVQECLGLKQARSLSSADSEIEREFLFATKVALLFCKDMIIIPPSALTECAYVDKTLAVVLPFRDLGLVWFADSVSSPLEFREKKIRQYAVDPDLVPVYTPAVGTKAFEKEFKFPHYGKWKQRVTGATPVIKRLWVAAVGKEQVPSRQLYAYRRLGITGEEFDQALQSLPERLETTAFITSFVIPQLPTGRIPDHLVAEIRTQIARFYIQSYLEEFNAICLKDFETVSVNSFIPAGGSHLSLRQVQNALLLLGLDELFERTLTCEDLVYLRLLDKGDDLLHLILSPIKSLRLLSVLHGGFSEQCVRRIAQSTSGMERATILLDLVQTFIDESIT